MTVYNKQHIIKPSLRPFQQRYVLFYDTETRPVETYQNLNGEFHKLWFLCYEFTKITENGESEVLEKGHTQDLEFFWDVIVKKMQFYGEIYLIAHNQQFDLAVIDIDHYYEKYEMTCKELVIDFGKVMISLSKVIDGRRVSLKIRDTLNYFPGSVESLGKIVGFKKYSFPTDDDEFDVWVMYCFRDVEIIRLFYVNLIRFTIDNEFGAFAETIASQSFTAFRNRFMFHQIYCHDRNSVIALERMAYHGGRVEAFFIGTIWNDIYKLDVNSMYPSVMKKYEYPVKLISEYVDISVSDMLSLIKQGYLVTACVKADLTENSIGIISDDDRFIFPVGKNVTCYLSTPEILLIQENILKVENLAVYEKAEIFSSFVDFFYEKKKSSKDNPTNAALYKLILNSLYGKFGQRNEDWTDVKDIDLGDDTFMSVLNNETGTVDEYRQILGKVQKRTPAVKNSYNAMVAIASHVTAYARCYLWELMSIAGKGNTYYVDTDCLFTNESGFNNLSAFINDNDLGFLKCEGIFSSGTIYGNKDYRLTQRKENGKMVSSVKRKGIRKKAKLISKNTYEQLKFNKWSVLSGQGITGGILIQNQKKHLKRTYDKAIVLSDGWTTPLFIPDFSSDEKDYSSTDYPDL